jgi:hypothetical protein
VDRTLTVHRHTPDGYLVALRAAGDERVRAEPFDAIELQVGMLLGDAPTKRDRLGWNHRNRCRCSTKALPFQADDSRRNTQEHRSEPGAHDVPSPNRVPWTIHGVPGSARHLLVRNACLGGQAAPETTPGRTAGTVKAG